MSMINPVPYRIGNYVKNGKGTYIVAMVGEPDDIYVKDEEGGYIPFSIHVEGIELTEDWLRRLGFSKQLIEPGDPTGGHYFSYSFSDAKYCDLGLLSFEEAGVLYVGLFPYEDFFNYKHVHEVQNLVHSITGKDIDVIA